MIRRDFLKAGLAGGLIVAVGCASRKPTDTEPTTAAEEPFDLDESTVEELQEAMEVGSETAESITAKYLERIEEIDGHGPTLRSVIEINPDAMEIAEALDEERQQGGARGPMHGIPVFIKDNIETGDSMMTTAGSLAMVGNIASQDSFLAAQLRKAGAVILGKTNLSEWANFRSTHSTSGWSGRGGQCKNPYALDRNPCGSSAGSGAAASANLCAVAIGTETDGSVVCPATTCGIVGIKPTLGMVSRTGIIPIAHSQDTAGPMARTVRDAATLLSIMAGQDPADPTDRYEAATDYRMFLEKDGLKGARIGVGRQFFEFNDHVDAIMEEAIAAMKGLGAEIVDPADMATQGKYDDTEFEVLLYEFKADLNRYMAGTSTDIGPKSLADLIEANERMKDQAMPFFGQEIFHMAQEKGPLTDKKYIDALAKNHRMSRDEGIDATMDEHNLDAIIAPTGSPAWPTDHLNGDHFTGGSSTPAAVSGYPNITVPAGFVGGLPVGVSFFGRAWSEPVLLKLAYAFEQETQVRKSPLFLPTADLS
ncbi:MAG: amidase [Armatimonadetes bacterium]|nr:amidase [Armatimonadota bacterium]